MSSSVLQPAFLAGVVIGVLSGLPVVSAGNCCCCLWVVAGGALAAYLVQQNTPRPISMADGMFAGLLAGIFGALIGAPIAWVANALMGNFIDQAAILDRILENAGNLPPEMREALERARGGAFAAGAAGVGMAVVGLLISLVVNSIFGTLGGLIGAMLFKKEPPADATYPPPVPPPPPPALPDSY